MLVYLIQGLEVITVYSSSVPGVLIPEVISRMECDANGVSPVPGLGTTQEGGEHDSGRFSSSAYVPDPGLCLVSKSLASK